MVSDTRIQINVLKFYSYPLILWLYIQTPFGFKFALPLFFLDLFTWLAPTKMDSESPPHNDMDVSIIDKDESSDKAYHVVDGFVIEDSKQPFPVG